MQRLRTGRGFPEKKSFPWVRTIDFFRACVYNTRKGPAFLKKAGTPEVIRAMLSEKKVDSVLMDPSHFVLVADFITSVMQEIR